MVIMVAIDMHVKRLVCELGCGRDEPQRRWFSNDEVGHRHLLDEIACMQGEHGGGKVIVAYEASGLGYGLYDRIREWTSPDYVELCIIGGGLSFISTTKAPLSVQPGSR